ncbi:unnamed protein product [Rotaria socialis]|uniref:Uncharacterized protein n=1 Tax=Rotaria socialis TaxID=392032 RepID=A0A821A4L6_9BILA|nr:unnamed protein product [Rotaria socialis]CAF4571792.1 unnamed protein product [Rotaria socialis]
MNHSTVLIKKLDRLARDITFTRSIDFVTILSNKKSKSRRNSTLDRFCVDIIPRIQHNIESLTLDRLSIDRVLRIGNYLKLWKLTLVNLSLKTARDIFNDNFGFSPLSLRNLSSTTFYSSSIGYLNVTVRHFNDCLCLLDGRFTCLHTVIVKVGIIKNSSKTINNKKIVSNLKCFSLFSLNETTKYDNRIVPLLQQMSQLEKLTLSLCVTHRASFIDGTQLYNDVLKNMPHLQSFFFYIVTEYVQMKKELVPLCDNIRRTFVENGYSLPFNMERMHSVTNNFPGGLFMNVRRPFEHYFFTRISVSFSLLTSLEISNLHPQQKKFIQQPDEPDKTSLISIYSNLVELSFFFADIDYIKQFLLDSNMRLPHLNKLHVNYDKLMTVTNNFTKVAAHCKCEKLKYITFDATIPAIVYSKNFFLYFSSLETYKSIDRFLT